MKAELNLAVNIVTLSACDKVRTLLKGKVLFSLLTKRRQCVLLLPVDYITVLWSF